LVMLDCTHDEWVTLSIEHDDTTKQGPFRLNECVRLVVVRRAGGGE